MEHKVLDVCCGSKRFWFDKNNPSVTFVDIRRETIHENSRQGRRAIIVDPDIVASFADLPFEDCSFRIVVFDPPHLVRNGKNSRMAKIYGSLRRTGWKNEIARGFSECFRVLEPGGILIFKWNELDIPVSQILKLSTVSPLIGQRSGKASKTHWIIFMKP